MNDDASHILEHVLFLTLIPADRDFWFAPLVGGLIAVGMSFFHGGEETVRIVLNYGSPLFVLTCLPIALSAWIATLFCPRWRAIPMVVSASASALCFYLPALSLLG